MKKTIKAHQEKDAKTKDADEASLVSAAERSKARCRSFDVNSESMVCSKWQIVSHVVAFAFLSRLLDTSCCFSN